MAGVLRQGERIDAITTRVGVGTIASATVICLIKLFFLACAIHNATHKFVRGGIMSTGTVVLTDSNSDNNSVFTLTAVGNRAVTYLHDLDNGHAEHRLHYADFTRVFSIRIDDVQRAISLFHEGNKIFTIWGEVIHNNELYRYGQQPLQLKPLKVGDVLRVEDHTNPMNNLVLKIISLNI